MGGFYFTDLGKRFEMQRDHGGVYYAKADEGPKQFGTRVRAEIVKWTGLAEKNDLRK